MGVTAAVATPEDSATFTTFYGHERAGVLAVAHALCRSGIPAVAEDVVQDAFVRAYEHWDEIRHYDRPDLWVRRVAINLATSRYRRLTTEARRLRSMARPQATDDLELHRDTLEVFDAIRRLPRRQAQVVALTYLDQLSTADVAEVLGMAPGTVRTHLRRGLEGLRNDRRFMHDARQEDDR